MKWKPVIAYQKYEVTDFYDGLNCFAIGRGLSLIGFIKLQPVVY